MVIWLQGMVVGQAGRKQFASWKQGCKDKAGVREGDMSSKRKDPDIHLSYQVPPPKHIQPRTHQWVNVRMSIAPP